MPRSYHYIPYVNCPDLLVKAVGSVMDIKERIVVLDNRGMFSTEPSASQVLSEAGLSVALEELPISLTTAQIMNYMLWRSVGDSYFSWMHTDGESPRGGATELLALADSYLASGKEWGLIFTTYDVMCVYNVRALMSIGGWKWLKYPFYFLDNCLHDRLREAGYPLIESNIKVIHHNNASNTIKNDPERKEANDHFFPVCERLYKLDQQRRANNVIIS